MAELSVALVGNPNCGKTALFNSLTGLRKKVANYPGVTVDITKADLAKKYKGSFSLIDLPGTYSLDPLSDDEAITSNCISGKNGFELPDMVVNVIDATNLELGLSLTLDLINKGRPIVVLLNMTDLAQKSGQVLNLKKLSEELGVPVLSISATKEWGLHEAVEAIHMAIKEPIKVLKREWKDSYEKSSLVQAIIKQSVEQVGSRSHVTEFFDRIFIHPVLGPIVLLVFLALIFQAVFAWAEVPMNFIEDCIAGLSSIVSSLLPDGILKDLVIDGMISGVGSVIVFLPQIVILFSFILFLEDFGYMARASYLMDRIMGSVGLSGKAVIPLVSGLACAIPSIMSTRSIPSNRDRILTMMIAPLMTCSARIPVYTLLIAAFVPNTKYYGFGVQGMVMFGLYLAGVLAVLGAGFILKLSILKGEAQPLLIELPSYKFPSPKLLLIAIFDRARMFLKRAGTFILAISIVLWAMTSFPKPPENAPLPAIEYSVAGMLGKIVEPLVAPIGFNYPIAVSLIPGFAAREVMVSSLSTVYAIQGDSEDSININLGHYLKEHWSLATALALLAWYVFSPQCLATFSVLGRESRSWKLTGGIFLFYLGLAWMAAFVVYRITSWLML
jgi:ferrous iron transport protein B